MKSIVILYNESDCSYKNEKVFGRKSAVEKTTQFFAENNFPTVTKVFTVENKPTITELLSEINQIASANNADFVIFSYNDLPFLNLELTKKLIENHKEYRSEYTFADGYPYGFTPEIIDCGTLRILEELTKTTQIELGKSEISRDWLYSLIKTDINSFEVESILAPEDWRLYRFAFHCGKKDNFMQCVALENAMMNDISGTLNSKNTTMPDINCSINNSLSVNELCKIASKTLGCLKTIPGFYNIQIADKVCSDSIYLPYNKAYEEKYSLSPVKSTKSMSYENFATLVEKIAEFSEKAVISLSAWGEPFENPDCLKMIEKILSYDGLSVFIETKALSITDDFCNELQKIVEKSAKRTNGWQKIMMSVILDSMTSKTYVKLHPNAKEEDFQIAVNNISKLQNVIPSCVYPQFVRMNENEDELEAFYRYWSEKSNASNGNVIIQKYDDYAGLLPQCKPADLSPLERDPCWHIRRDMTILSNGDVPSCHSCVLSEIVGNVFTQSLEEVWHKSDELLNQHINKKYNQRCERCDEYYTFNF